jgi:D-alanyl-D-alanine carboxypeptidase
MHHPEETLTARTTVRRNARLLASAVLLPALLLGGPATASADSPGPTATALAARPPLPPCRHLDLRTRYRELWQWRRTLLDTRLRVWKRYVPDDLVSVSGAGIGGSGSVRALVIDDLRAMAAAARAAGKPIAVRSAYRSYAQQKAVFDSWVAAHGLDYALRYSARPGHSEHQLGTAIDFRSASSMAPGWRYVDWGRTGPGRWMRRNAWKFGFVMSYPKGTSAETCYGYEPWHYRYVGRPLARKIHDSGLTTRRYLWRHFETAS